MSSEIKAQDNKGLEKNNKTYYGRYVIGFFKIIKSICWVIAIIASLYILIVLGTSLITNLDHSMIEGAIAMFIIIGSPAIVLAILLHFLIKHY